MPSKKNGLQVCCGNVVSIYEKNAIGSYVLDKHHGVNEVLGKALKLVEDSRPIIL